MQRDAYEEVLKSDFRPDICSEMCPCHDPISYIPSGYTPEEADQLRIDDREKISSISKRNYETPISDYDCIKSRWSRSI